MCSFGERVIPDSCKPLRKLRKPGPFTFYLPITSEQAVNLNSTTNFSAGTLTLIAERWELGNFCPLSQQMSPDLDAFNSWMAIVFPFLDMQKSPAITFSKQGPPGFCQGYDSLESLPTKPQSVSADYTQEDRYVILWFFLFSSLVLNTRTQVLFWLVERSSFKRSSCEPSWKCQCFQF